MAAVVPTSDQATEFMQKLSLETQIPESTMKYAPVESSTLANGLNKPFERSTTPFPSDFMDPNVFYNPNGYPSSTYYYGGYDGSVNQWDGYINPDGVDMSPGLYGDYHHGYGYAPYGAYSPSDSSMGHDGLYGAQHYQYPTSYYQPFTTTTGPHNHKQTNASQANVSTSIGANQVPLSAESAKGNQNGIGNVTVNRTAMLKPLRPSYQNSSAKSSGSYGWGDFRSASTGISSAYSQGSNFSSGRSQNVSPLSTHLMGLQQPRATPGLGHTGFMNQMYLDNRMYNQYASTFRTGSNAYDPRINTRGWMGYDSKYKPRGRGNGSFVYGNDGMDGLNELNRGPRAKGFLDQKDSEPITLAVKGQILPLNGTTKDNLPLFPDREQYNKEDFPETHSDAKFFVIKSYSEDDVHKSIKYCMWASTPNGNQKLDAAYKEAQEKSDGCPVFLLFSVNASGQFVGLAEMVGFVDFNESLDYWQQDKWSGGFPLKWHIVKDVPNSLLRHITLENNENKPVTNSRDTQEVGLEHGIQILKIFKGHSSKTCILDDFEFYERRQKTMQEKKTKQRLFNKQVGNEKLHDAVLTDDKDKDGSIGKPASEKSMDIASAVIEGSVSTTAAVPDMVKCNADRKLIQQNGLVVAADDAAKGSNPVVVANKLVSNGVANVC